jgi:transposase-like protein
VAKRIYDNPARRAWWQVHIEAWQKSGMTIAGYCRTHGLTVDRFRRWRSEIAAWTEQKTVKSQRRKKQWIRISKDKRRQATQAFWAMHVEAWTWSGLHLRDYAATHRLSPYSLKKWRNLFDNEEMVADWRTMLHPSALPLISTRIGTGAKEKAAAERLTAVIEAEAPPPKRATRRRWTTEEKIALLLQAERYGSTITSVAQAHGIATSVMFRWRDQLGVGKDDPAVILPVRVAEARDRRASGAPSLLADLLPRPEGMIEVALADGRLVFAPEGSDPEVVQREVTARELRP